MHSQVHRGHHDAVRAHPGDIGGELHPGVMPGHGDQFGVAVYLGIPRTSGGRAVGLLVIGLTPKPPSPDTRVRALTGPVSLLDHPPAQPKAPVYPMLYTHAPNTWPTGSKPAPRTAVNPPADSNDPQVPPPRV